MHLTPPPLTLENFRRWLSHEISQCTGLQASDIDLGCSIHALGVSSVHVVRLAGEIEDQLAIDVDPTAFYDFASIDTLCSALWGIHERRKRRHSGSTIDRSVHATQSLCRRPALPTPYFTPRTDWEQRVATMWCDVLQIEQVGIHDNFFALGGDAQSALEVCARLGDLGVPNTVTMDHESAHTVAGLCHQIESVLVLVAGQPMTRSARWGLDDDTQLADDIGLPEGSYTLETLPLRRIFLTGATGYLGAFLLYEFLRQTQAHVVCLVRAASPQEGWARVRDHLRELGLETPDLTARVSVITGDLTAPRMGLDPNEFTQLAADIDAIVHCAAAVNFLASYQHLKASNVDATETLLRLACAARPKPIQFHFISTLALVMATGYGRDTLMTEALPLSHHEDLISGYEQSKYVSDALVWQALKQRGIPCAIYRPPLISGPSDGRYHQLGEFLPQALKGCLQLGAFPLLDGLLEIAPIDFVSRAIVHIARDPTNLNQAYFITHPDSQPLSHYLTGYLRAGWSLQGLSWDQWKQKFLNLDPESFRKNALFPFVNFLRFISREQAFFPRIDSCQFKAATRRLGWEPPPVRDLLERYTRYFIATGFYDDVPGVPLHLTAMGPAENVQYIQRSNTVMEPVG